MAERWEDWTALCWAAAMAVPTGSRRVGRSADGKERSSAELKAAPLAVLLGVGLVARSDGRSADWLVRRTVGRLAVRSAGWSAALTVCRTAVHSAAGMVAGWAAG